MNLITNNIAIAIRNDFNTIDEYLKFCKIFNYCIEEDGIVINQNCKLLGVINDLPFKLKTCNGNLDLSYNRITDLKNLGNVLGNISLKNNYIISLSKPFYSDGNIDISFNSNFNSLLNLPSVINGDLDVSNCNISSINFGRETTIHGSFRLNNNRIASIGHVKSLTVHKSVYLSNNLITRRESTIKCEDIQLDGNPCMADQEWETNCNW